MEGQRFGRWTCLQDVKVNKRNEKKRLCVCDCGTKRYVLERSLKSGGSLSCGCLRKERAAEAITLELTGKTFGELTVLGKAETAGPHGVKWVCQCSCGNRYEAAGTLLVRGRRTHCSGPAHKKNYASADISGQKFRRLTALYPTEKRSAKGSVVWHCICECGREIDVTYNNLLYTGMQSCGCKKKEHDQALNTMQTHVAGTSIELLQSSKTPKNSTTGRRGVYLIKGKYVAKINFQKKAYYLGTFDQIEEAAAVRKEAEELLFEGTTEHYRKWELRAAQDPQWAERNPIEIHVTNHHERGIAVEFLPPMTAPLAEGV